MKLSYIIPVYNVEKYLGECVDSILSQKFDDYEIILVDDESPDSCPKICDEYADKYPDIVKVIHQENSGPAAARNNGLEIADGKYIWFVDSDDILNGDHVADIFDCAEKYDIDILQMPFYQFNDGEKSFIKADSVFEKDRLFCHDEMVTYVSTSSTDRSVVFAWRNIYKKSFLDDKNIRFDPSLRMIEDPAFNTLAFLKAERVVAVDITAYAYRVRRDSLQRKKYIKDYDEIMNYQWSLKLKYFRENSDNNSGFYNNIAEFTLKVNLPILLNNIYINNVSEKYSLLKRIGNSEMIRKSFADFDINEYKSRSLDWWATYFIKKKTYPLAHLICKRILYK